MRELRSILNKNLQGKAYALDPVVLMGLKFQLEMFQSQYTLCPIIVYFLVCYTLYVYILHIQPLADLGKFRFKQFKKLKKKTETVTFLKSAPNFS
jgi:Ni/Fe-hydrogenase subunit HybB-like protein